MEFLVAIAYAVMQGFTFNVVMPLYALFNIFMQKEVFYMECDRFDKEGGRIREEQWAAREDHMV